VFDGVLTISSDDLTVEVIFFGNGDKSGDVVVNKEASAATHDIKAKL
jgi:pyruvate dehydrogenase phosphatase